MGVGTKIATMPDVREWSEGYPVELWTNEAGRVVVRAYNECGNNVTEVDLFDLISWCRGNRTALPTSVGLLANNEEEHRA